MAEGHTLTVFCEEYEACAVDRWQKGIRWLFPCYCAYFRVGGGAEGAATLLGLCG